MGQKQQFVVQPLTVTDEQKISFLDRTQELYHRIKKGVIPPEFVLDRIQKMIEGDFGTNTRFDSLRLWSTPRVIHPRSGYSLGKLLEQISFYCPGKLKKASMIEMLGKMFEIENDAEEEFSIYTAVLDHKQMLTDAKKHNLFPKTSIRHVCEAYFSHIERERRLLDESE